MLNQTLQYDEKTIFPYKQTSYYIQKNINTWQVQTTG